MDVLETLDLDTKVKKSRRVRSWYLYEQYRSLEKHQLDAAQKLKDKSYQDKILRQELSERRARRKLYDQFGLCQSESRLHKLNNHPSTVSALSSVSNDEFFESLSFSGQEDERITEEIEFDCGEELSVSKSYTEDFKPTDDQKDNVSDSGSINSVVENLSVSNDEHIELSESVISIVENMPNNDESHECEYENAKLEIIPVVIAQDINKQLDSIKDDIQCLEDVTKLDDDDDDDDKSSGVVSECSVDVCRLMTPIENEEGSEKIISIWSRLVSFAYQVVKLNHGNCYCDYSSQFLTAVLACDVLRLGVYRMLNYGTILCSTALFQNLILIGHILQPYVSPINFVTDNMKSESRNKYAKRKKSEQSRKASKISEIKPRMNQCNNSSKKVHGYHSENCWHCRQRQLTLDHRHKSGCPRRSSEPWRSVINPFTESSSASSNTFLYFGKKRKARTMFGCPCCKKAVNPMLKIARYIDCILKDMNVSKHM